MKQFISAIILLVLIFSCTEKKQSLPPAAESKETINKFIKGKNYKSEKLALLSPFKMDKENPYQWFDEMKDTSAFFKNYEKERMSFSLSFSTDSSAIINDNNKKTSGVVKVEQDTNDEGESGLYIKISYEDQSMNLFPGQTSPMIMTSSYKVLGIDENYILLETPFGFNRNNVIILMKAD
jgi:hypothetical protein